MTSSLSRSAIVAAILVVLAVIGWETYLRSTHLELSYDDGGPLWSHLRSQVYEPADKATVFIGSSRIKFDLDIDTWEKLTGDHAIQLSCVGSSPTPLLSDLADDPKFKGKLIIDVTEGLFFSINPQNAKTPNEVIDYHKKNSPTRKASFALNTPLESAFVFLDKDHYSINARLDALKIPSRPGVFVFPVFPRDFGYTKFRRQDFMGPIFLADTFQQHEQQRIWAFFGRMNRFPPVTGAPLDSIIQSVKKNVDKIKARGGKVLFVRTPSSGPYFEKEKMGFPRDKYWDRLLVETGCVGIHFKDFPEMDHYECPEFSHLSPEQAIDFTTKFVEILQQKIGWKFPNQTKM
jgi:hypothetical protein